eukprot:3414332-Rhodomonas_salina.2
MREQRQMLPVLSSADGVRRLHRGSAQRVLSDAVAGARLHLLGDAVELHRPTPPNASAHVKSRSVERRDEHRKREREQRDRAPCASMSELDVRTNSRKVRALQDIGGRPGVRS